MATSESAIHGSTRGRTAAAVLWFTVAGYVAAFLVSAPWVEYNATGSFAITPLVVLVGVLLSRGFARRQEDKWIARVIMAGYLLKLVGSAVFFWLVFAGPGGDARRYHLEGAQIARAVWGGEVSSLWNRGLTGTAMMDQLAGAVYTVMTPAAATGFALFATASFVGSYLFYRAFAIAVPQGNRRLYAALVFLVPSVLFWPTSLGKEAWMMLTLGSASYGAAQLLAGKGGVASLLVGITGAGLMRPHMAALTAAALMAATLARRRPAATPWQRRGRVVLLVIVLVAGAAAAIAAQQTFGLTSASPDAVVGFLESVSERTERGGSGFKNVETINPLLTPVALVSVLFRPFPHEARSAIMILASIEGVAMAALIAHRRRSLVTAFRSVRENGLVAYSAVYTALFALSYSFFNNLGLLARERVQLLPILFVLLALPRRNRLVRRHMPALDDRRETLSLRASA